MKKQITISLIILTILSSCGTKKQITNSSIENNITTQIDDSININSSSNTITEVDDSIEISISEIIEETISDTLNGQTIQRTTKRKSTIRKSGNTRIQQSEETDTTHNKHIQNQEKKKEDNQSTTTINKSNPIKRYILMILFMIAAVLIFKYTNKK